VLLVAILLFGSNVYTCPAAANRYQWSTVCLKTSNSNLPALALPSPLPFPLGTSPPSPASSRSTPRPSPLLPFVRVRDPQSR
jgi:hypothetical protein